MEYKLPELNYAYDALEPHIDAQTMEIHHSKHHQAYTDKMNEALKQTSKLNEKSLEETMKEIHSLEIDPKIKQGFINHGGGYLNHKLFWETLDPNNQKNEELSQEIVETFGSLEEFRTLFEEAAKTQFGSGWAWLVRNESGKLEVYSLSNQDSPLSKGHTPILNLDVWEHAYYLKYQNRRPEYVEAFWNMLKLI